ncbi:rhodanese-like domain-containing protein [Lapillicoccus jejuensis]|uniref:Rhodanese-related sulfurtransferase n=1 Tax=Lapillicoccus jejuensis TaxID=402171 RepID=A0A542E152_9MICO|nr:rhodanese-like domain-containing protein [Lapillicoccus jejuensis]TQJ09045.1 rhodanese-related sulfurtransferase [Lapillicoccus jejuensis]
MSSEVSIEELAAAQRGDGTVIDVREPREYAAGHVPGARSIPMGQLASRRAELDPTRSLHVICASGNRSAAMTDFLRGVGFDAASVVGGTDAWVRSGRPLVTGSHPTATAQPSTRRPVVVTIETPTLGNRSYLAHDGRVAVLVDPQRDLDRVLAAAQEAGVRITHVVETHVHNDYVTGGLALARATGASYHLNAADEVRFARTPVHDGDVIDVSPSMRLRAIATPGHTFTHLSYALEAVTSVGGSADTVAVFTGGSLLYGATGRPDLLGPDHTDALVHHQYASAHRLARQLPDHAQVLPTHGFGSFCSAGSSGGTSESTIGAEKAVNPALTTDEEQWVADTLAGLDAYPAYYVHMAPANVAGPDGVHLDAPAVADRTVLAGRLAAGEWVVDLRTRTAFAAGHVVGTLNIGLDGQFATYLGWLVPHGASLTLLGESTAQVAEAQRELARIGVDVLAGAATGGPGDWTDDGLGHFPRAVFADLVEVRHHRTVTVLDVRRQREHDAGHLVGALHIPLHDLVARLDEVPGDAEVWVHCAGGYRASIAASILAAQGRRVVAVDDEFDHAARAGLPLATT